MMDDDFITIEFEELEAEISFDQVINISSVNAEWGDILGDIERQIDLWEILEGKEEAIAPGNSDQYLNGQKQWVDVAGLPISTATQNALDDVEQAIALKQSLSEKNQPDGYPGLNAEGKVPANLLDIVIDYPVTSVNEQTGDIEITPASIGAASQEALEALDVAIAQALTALQQAIDLKENIDNKATDLLLPNNTKYPTTQAVVTGLNNLAASIPTQTSQLINNSGFLVGNNLPNGIIINGVAYINQATKPTQRPDGNALVIGDRWYNPATGVEGFWNGTYWLGRRNSLAGSHTVIGDEASRAFASHNSILSGSLLNSLFVERLVVIYRERGIDVVYDSSNYWRFDFTFRGTRNQVNSGFFNYANVLRLDGVAYPFPVLQNQYINILFNSVATQPDIGIISASIARVGILTGSALDASYSLIVRDILQ